MATTYAKPSTCRSFIWPTVPFANYTRTSTRHLLSQASPVYPSRQTHSWLTQSPFTHTGLHVAANHSRGIVHTHTHIYMHTHSVCAYTNTHTYSVMTHACINMKPHLRCVEFRQFVLTATQYALHQGILEYSLSAYTNTMVN